MGMGVVTDVYPMVTDVYPMLAKESSVANPQKIAKIDENIKKIQKDGLATLHLPDFSVVSVKSVVIGTID
jgi:hypothetical protein